MSYPINNVFCTFVFSSEIMKEDYNETVHKKAEVIQMCNFCSQTLEKIEKLWVDYF